MLEKIKGPALIVFGGLPGTGKSALARMLAVRLQAVYLRIDTIEQALRNVKALKKGNEGYLTAYAIAEDNLRAWNIVVADSVNPVPETREAWRSVAMRNIAKLVEVEVICSDQAEHKRRVETREADIAGHKLPTWKDVTSRQYHPWGTRDFVIDTADKTIDEAFEGLRRALYML
jgi:predicted kinase